MRLAIGPDVYGPTSLAEATNRHALGVFDDATLLAMRCETTAPALFPERRIGRLAEGLEARYLALDGDPIERFEDVRRIPLRVKGGRVLSEPSEAAPR